MARVAGPHFGVSGDNRAPKVLPESERFNYSGVQHFNLADEISDLTRAVGAINRIRQHLRNNSIIDAAFVDKQVYDATLLEEAPDYDESQAVHRLLNACTFASERPNDANARQAVLQNAVYVITGGIPIDDVVSEIAMRAFDEPDARTRKKAFAGLHKATTAIAAPRSLLRPPAVPTPRRVFAFMRGTKDFLNLRSSQNAFNDLAFTKLEKAARPNFIGRFRQRRGLDGVHNHRQEMIAQGAADTIGATFSAFSTELLPQTKRVRAGTAQVPLRSETMELPVVAPKSRVSARPHVATSAFYDACVAIDAAKYKLRDDQDRSAVAVAAVIEGNRVDFGAPTDALFAFGPLIDFVVNRPDELASQAKVIQDTAEQVAHSAAEDLHKLRGDIQVHVRACVHMLAGFEGAGAKIQHLDRELNPDLYMLPAAAEAAPAAEAVPVAAAARRTRLPLLHRLEAGIAM